MSYDPPYRPTIGYAEQQWPASGAAEPQWQASDYADYAERDFPGYSHPEFPRAEYAVPPDTFDGGNQDFGSFADLRSADPESTWRDEAVPHGPGVITGAVMGFLAAAVAIGVATLAAAFFRPQASPIIAVGEAFIDRTPAALKEFAIQKFGEHDKMALLISMYVTIGLLAMLIGVLARRWTLLGVVGITVFGLFGAFVAYTRPASRISDVIPSLIGAIAGVAAMLWLASAAHGSNARGGTR